jgi:hypothetical protein
MYSHLVYLDPSEISGQHHIYYQSQRSTATLVPRGFQKKSFFSSGRLGATPDLTCMQVPHHKSKWQPKERMIFLKIPGTDVAALPWDQ